MAPRDARPPLERIQRHLDAIYDLGVEERVGDFLIDDRERARLVAAGLLAAPRPDAQEEVLVMAADGELSLALWLRDDVRRRLAGGSRASLQDHCHATEGVSHFLMLLWSARQGRELRLLDLELQAEIDKAGSVLLLDRARSGGVRGPELLARLFDGAALSPHLPSPDADRYREAHRLAAAYARRLLALVEKSVDAMLAELRTLYRLPAEAKRERVAELARAA